VSAGPAAGTERDDASALPSRRVLVLRRAWRGFLRGRAYDSAAALTFFGALALLPAGLLAVTTVSLLDGRAQAVDDLTAIATTFAPDSAETVHDALGELLELDNPGLALLLGLVLTVWTVSGYAAAFGRAVDAVYESQEGRRWPLFRAEMLAVALVVVVLASIAAAILLLTPTASGDILARRGVDPVIETIWNVAKWPVLVVVLVVLIAVLYSAAPGVRLPRLRWLTLGSAMALGVWAVLTGLFALYVTLTGAYGHLYGRLGLLLAGLLWLYLSNAALLIGVQLDSELLRVRQLDEGIAAEEQIVVPLKRTERVLRLAAQRSEDIADAQRLRDAARDRADDDASPDAEVGTGSTVSPGSTRDR
jgi:membrane protein